MKCIHRYNEASVCGRFAVNNTNYCEEHDPQKRFREKQEQKRKELRKFLAKAYLTLVGIGACVGLAKLTVWWMPFACAATAGAIITFIKSWKLVCGDDK